MKQLKAQKQHVTCHVSMMMNYMPVTHPEGKGAVYLPIKQTRRRPCTYLPLSDSIQPSSYRISQQINIHNKRVHLVRPNVSSQRRLVKTRRSSVKHRPARRAFLPAHLPHGRAELKLPSFFQIQPDHGHPGHRFHGGQFARLFRLECLLTL